MRRTVFMVMGILLLSLVAAGLTELTLVLGHPSRVSDDRAARPSPLVTPTSIPTPTPTPSVAPTPTPTPSPSPVVTPVPGTTAVTSSFVRLRAGASTSTAVLAELNGGTVVTLAPYRDSQWQQVVYNGTTGYIFRSYLIYR